MFRRWMREQQAQREEQVEEVWSSFEAVKDPIYSSGEEEEDPSSSDGYGSEEEQEDEDSPPASVHWPITRSTSKKSVSQPKRKAYRSKGSGLGGSSWKQFKGQR